MANEFTIAVGEEKLRTSKQKLDLATYPDELDEAGWDYGAPSADVKRLAAYWKDGFDWTKQEAKSNESPNYVARIKVDGFDESSIHYSHQKSDSPNAIPSLFCHGWPGSYLEVTKSLCASTQESAGIAFHVVAPSLPNFAWSSGVKKKGFGLAQYAETCNKSMQHLGYPTYVTQGGDWGFYITRMMGHLYPSAVKASHINMVRASPPTFTSHPVLAAQHALTPYTAAERQGLERSKWFQDQGSGYRVSQSTKPQTIGYASQDSPVASLAWSLEKSHDWTDAYPWTDDEICTWVSMYWFSAAGPAASVRIYYEATHGNPAMGRDRTQAWIGAVKSGSAYAPMELSVVPRTWGRTLGEVVFESEKVSGGHFLAWERPDEVVKDSRAMFGDKGPCYRIV